MPIFMHAEGIRGAAQDNQHRGWIKLESIEWGVQRQLRAPASTRGGRESSNTEISELVFTKTMDRCSPQIFIEACCGWGREIILEVTQSGQGAGTNPYMRYVLKNALISSYSLDATAQDISRPLERVTLSFTGLEVRYTPYDQDGKALAPISVSFDAASNTKK